MNLIGYQIVADASVTTVIGISGRPVIIYGYNSANKPLSFIDSSTSAVILDDDDAVEGMGTHMFQPGLMFPNGCSIASGTGAVTVFYRQIT